MYIERSLSFAEADTLINLELHHLGLEAKLSSVATGNFSSYECKLFNTHTPIFIERGFGKGNSEEAQLGAKFEALEHFTSIVSHLNINYCYTSLTELQAMGCSIIKSKIPRQILNNSKYQRQKLAWLKYTDYSKSTEHAYAPAASVNPFYLLDNKFPEDNFPYDEIYMQNSNNGVAIGCNQTEALIHAISECIERDALSFFLADNFILQRPNSLQLVDPMTISLNNQELIERLKNELQLEAKILYMLNDFGVPSFCTVIQDSHFVAPIQGFGASLNAEHALYRSICECIELLNFYDDIDSYESKTALKIFVQIPKLLNCVQFDINQIISNGNFSTLDFASIPTYTAIQLDTYLQELIQRVLNTGFSVYYKILYKSENICTAHAIIPETENLFNILKGIVPQFNKRISTHLKQQDCNEKKLA